MDWQTRICKPTVPTPGAQGARRWAAVRRTTFGGRAGFALDPPGPAAAAPAEGAGQGTRTARSMPQEKTADAFTPAICASCQPERTEPHCVALDPQQLQREDSHERAHPSRSLDRDARTRAAEPSAAGAGALADGSAEPRPQPWQAPDAVQAYDQACQDARAPVSVRVRALLGTPCANLGACRLGRLGAAAVAAALRAPAGCHVRRLMLARNGLDAVVRLPRSHFTGSATVTLLRTVRPCGSEARCRLSTGAGCWREAAWTPWCGCGCVYFWASHALQRSVRDLVSARSQ